MPFDLTLSFDDSIHILSQRFASLDAAIAWASALAGSPLAFAPRGLVLRAEHSHAVFAISRLSDDGRVLPIL
jgi:hypothetical protein